MKNKYSEFVHTILSWNHHKKQGIIIIFSASIYAFFLTAVMSYIGDWKLTYIMTILLSLLTGRVFVVTCMNAYIKVVGKNNGKDVQNMLRLETVLPFFNSEYFKYIECRIWKKVCCMTVWYGTGIFLSQMINFSASMDKVIGLTVLDVILFLVVCKLSLYAYRLILKIHIW